MERVKRKAETELHKVTNKTAPNYVYKSLYYKDDDLPGLLLTQIIIAIREMQQSGAHNNGDPDNEKNYKNFQTELHELMNETELKLYLRCLKSADDQLKSLPR